MTVTCWAASIASAQQVVPRADLLNADMLSGFPAVETTYPPTTEVAPPRIRKGWYNRLIPRQGGPSCLIGPWFSLAAARDWRGSAEFSHPRACPETGPRPPANCRNTGNGYAFLKGAPYPATWQTAPGDAELLPTKDNPHLNGKWIRIWYGDDGTCQAVVKGQKPPPMPGQFTYYHPSKPLCPGWPFLYIGDSGGPYGDGVCG